MSIWTKLFPPQRIEPVMPMPRIDFTPIQRPTAAELLVSILDDDRVPAEVRLEYYAKFVANMARPSGIIKFNGPVGNEAWETCTESLKASRMEEPRWEGKQRPSDKTD